MWIRKRFNSDPDKAHDTPKLMRIFNIRYQLIQPTLSPLFSNIERFSSFRDLRFLLDIVQVSFCLQLWSLNVRYDWNVWTKSDKIIHQLDIEQFNDFIMQVVLSNKNIKTELIRSRSLSWTWIDFLTSSIKIIRKNKHCLLSWKKIIWEVINE